VRGHWFPLYNSRFPFQGIPDDFITVEERDYVIVFNLKF
jgi:hypothetical protein